MASTVQSLQSSPESIDSPVATEEVVEHDGTVLPLLQISLSALIAFGIVAALYFDRHSWY